MRQWFELCGEENHKLFIGYVCAYFNHKNKIPSSKMIIEVENLIEENDIEISSSSILKFLIVGLWVDGFEERAKGYVDQLAKLKSGDYLLLQLAAQCIETDVPKLGFYVAGQRKVPNTFMLNGYHKATDRYLKLAKDKRWMRQQSPLIQMVIKMSCAYRLIADTEKK